MNALYNLYVNGKAISDPVELATGDRIVVGNQHCFRFMNPMQALHQRERGGSIVNDKWDNSTVVSMGNDSGAASGSLGLVDAWTLARMELLKKEGIDLVAHKEER